MIQYLQRQPIGAMQNSQALAKQLGVDDACAALLCMRGYDQEETARVFLQPDLNQLHDPFLFEQMGDAVDCIQAAVDMGERICVYGDYDVDGIMAVTIMTRYLLSIGADVFSYIPQRHAEGYGLNMEAIDKVLLHGATLLITVDCGITAIQEAAYAQSMGLEMIITDHHQAYETLPDVAAIVNPACSKTYPFAHLCGAGVALKLVQALGGIQEVTPYLQYATMATIADIVQLTGENRVIAAQGLLLINSDECAIGIKALAEAAGQVNRRMDESSIGFSLAPRVNAAGRTGSPSLALDLFLSDDIAEVKRLAKQLDEQNKNRQEIESVIMKQALAMISQTVDIVDDCAIVLAHEDWNAGVIGIVASRLVERFSKPVILFANDSQVCTGSGRSVKGVHLFCALEAIQAQGALFERYGGHEMAAGLSIKSEKLQEFKEKLQVYLSKNVDQNAYIPKMYYDMPMQPQQISMTMVENLGRLAPFGIGNPNVVFQVSGVVKNAQTRGNGAHLSFSLDGKVDCIAFGQGRRLLELGGEYVDMLCTAKINTFKEDKVQCEVKQIRIALQNTQDILRRTGWRFLDGYFQTPPTPASSAIQPLPLDEAQVCQALRQKPQGALLLCFTAQGAQDCFDFLTKNELQNAVDVSAMTIADERGYNTLLLAPYLDSANIARYKQIFIFDHCPAKAALQFLSTITPQIYSAGRLPDDYFTALLPSRNALIPVYKAMVALSVKEQTFASFEQYHDSLSKLIAVDPFACKFAMRVFGELGFIRIESGSVLTVAAVQNAPKKDLESSPSFALAQNANKNRCESM